MGDRDPQGFPDIYHIYDWTGSCYLIYNIDFYMCNYKDMVIPLALCWGSMYHLVLADIVSGIKILIHIQMYIESARSNRHTYLEFP